jgi:predicted metal-binding protein
MRENHQSILHYIQGLGATHCEFIPARHLVPEERIRGYCYQNVCGNYDKHLTCPPATGTISEIQQRLKRFKTGIVIQYSENVNVQKDKVGLRRTKLKLHHIVLETERYLKEKINPEHIWGMIGGNCDLCDECAGYRGSPCEHPDQARVSMEALAIDVIGLLKKLHLDAEFHPHKITWTGVVLMY